MQRFCNACHVRVFSSRPWPGEGLAGGRSHTSLLMVDGMKGDSRERAMEFHLSGTDRRCTLVQGLLLVQPRAGRGCAGPPVGSGHSGPRPGQGVVAARGAGAAGWWSGRDAAGCPGPGACMGAGEQRCRPLLPGRLPARSRARPVRQRCRGMHERRRNGLRAQRVRPVRAGLDDRPPVVRGLDRAAGLLSTRSDLLRRCRLLRSALRPTALRQLHQSLRRGQTAMLRGDMYQYGHRQD